MSLSWIFILFIVYSVIGWACEVAYCSIIERKFVNRGFLMGPLCPVYGFGALLVIFLLQPFASNVFYLFTMAILVTSTLEYLTGWALERIFATKWWDYSGYRFNIHGRVCLLNSLIFGAMSVLAVRFVHPAIAFAIGLIPPESLDAIAIAVAVALAIDLAVTLRALVDLGERLTALTEFMEGLKEAIDVREWFSELDLAGSLERIRSRYALDNSDRNRRLAERLESLVSRSRGMTRLMRAFPSMKSSRHGIQLELLKQFHSIKNRILPTAGARASAATSAVAAPSGGIAPNVETVRDETTTRGRKGPYEWFWIFFGASFAGVVLETIWCVVTTGSLQSRTGLIYGMLNPVYGAGALIMTAALSRLEKRRDFLVFLGGMAIGAAFEYACSLGQELVFGSVSWEYSGTQLNIHGRTNLMFALIWGLLGLLWVRDICPSFLALVARIPARAGRIVAAALFACVVANSALSAAAVHRWAERDRGVESENALDSFLDERYPDGFMSRVYPNLRFVER